MDSTNSTAAIHKQLRFWVAERLRADILEGKLHPGDWLRQERLAQEYGVSQMPIREAFKILEAEGLLEHVPYHGVRVVEFSIADIADLYATRSFLEARAARAAAEVISEEDLQTLKQLYQQMNDTKTPEDLIYYRQLNKVFHLKVAESSKRAYLTRTITQLWESFPSMMWSNFNRTATTPPHREEHDTDDHLALICALENHDPDEAERIVHIHVEITMQELIQVLTGGEK